MNNILIIIIISFMIGCSSPYMKGDMSNYSDDDYDCRNQTIKAIGLNDFDPAWLTYKAKCMEGKGYTVNEKYQKQLDIWNANRKVD